MKNLKYKIINRIKYVLYDSDHRIVVTGVGFYIFPAQLYEKYKIGIGYLLMND